VVGRSIVLNGTSAVIIGVMPPGFFGLEPGRSPDFWIPLSLYSRHEAQSGNANHGVPLLKDPTTWWLHVVGRLKSGVTDAEARSELSTLFDRIIGASAITTRPPGQTPRLDVWPMERGLGSLRNTYSTSLFLLMGMVGLVLLVACGNVAGLMLARATARQRELAVRLSLGASRARLIRQLLAESVLLAVMGGAAGLLVAVWITSALPALLSIELDLNLDLPVLAFTAVVSTLSGICFGLAPACRATRVEPLPALKQGRSPSGARAWKFASGACVSAGQVALCLILLIGAGLFTRTLQKLQAVDLGFDRQRLLFFQTRPGLNGYKDERLAAYYEDLQQRITSIPGVRAVSFSDRQPIGAGTGNSGARILGAAPPGDRMTVRRHQVGPGYFETLGVPIVLGRAIGSQDQHTSPHVVVINQRLARERFGREDPLGHQIDLGSGAPFEVVGVVKDVKDNQLRDATVPTVYLPYRQFLAIPSSMTFEVRGGGNLSALIDAIRREASSLDSKVPPAGMRLQTEIIDQTLAVERTFATLSTSFALLALLLACVGLYGTTAFTVARRTHEIGVRMALGAARGRILRMVLRLTLRVVAGGLAVGLLLALLAVQLLKSQLFGLAPYDPLTMLLAALVVVSVTALAGAIPAWRASRLDPLLALRCE
jgi:predicted permease